MGNACYTRKHRLIDDYAEPCATCAGGDKWEAVHGNNTNTDSCEFCKHQSKQENENPCNICSKAFTNNFEPLGYWDKINEMQKKQTAKGVRTYGQTLEENKSMSIDERLTYLEEELIDALMYIEHIKEGLK